MAKLSNLYSYALVWLNRLLKWYIVSLMALLVGLTFVQVLARYLMQSPFTSTPQLARICLVWLTFMGAAVAVRQDKNVRIGTLEQQLPVWLKKYLSVFLDLLLVVLLVMLTVKGYEVCRITTSQIILGTPFTLTVMYSSLVTGSALMLFFVVIRLLWKLGILTEKLVGKEN